MKTTFTKFAGYCLVIGSVLMILTMVLHPAGGDLEHIVSISNVLIISHSIAVFSVPFVAFGFYGLSENLTTNNRLSYLGFAFIVFALFAAMMAASINGLILPMYASKFSTESGQNLENVKLIISYGSKFNKAMDYIFIWGYSIAMFIWSVIIIQTSKLPRWIGFYGFILLAFVLLGFLLEYNFISVWGFRIYIFGIVSWIVLAGIFMTSKRSF
ncbi:hypothetical protein GCM10011514_38980 [Emticicia aquatilis]|uniref:DUF4386 domain-containing protein n=1 Tax=Emticicia aquatilis TaxID=1537369 RepID=A0A916Z2X8_9BACT|nr:hypothetical protein [Emticicia aquatilis]GGD71083.1 hypothetical protein GCM10011514_38980 [Emticicia aquatilis]